MTSIFHAYDPVMRDKKVVVFDLDGTLTESKQPLDTKMAGLLARLLAKHQVAVIGGGEFSQLKLQVLDPLVTEKFSAKRLYLFPLNGGAMFGYTNNEWEEKYNHGFSATEKRRIFEAFERAFKVIGFVKSGRLYGEEIEDRGSQITFSALGQEAPLEAKERWSQEHGTDREALAEKLNEELPDMEAHVAGLTSVDVTKKGIDKKLGIERLMEYLDVRPEDVLFVGDAFGPDGNDTPALRAGVSCVQVSSPKETKVLIQNLLD